MTSTTPSAEGRTRPSHARIGTTTPATVRRIVHRVARRPARLVAPVGARRGGFVAARVVAFALACAAALGPSALLAEDGARIGFVDIPYLIDRAPQALEAEKRLEAEFAPRQVELEMQRADLADLNARLDDLDGELSDAERAQLDREARALERRIKRSEQDFREELNIQKNDEFKTVRILVLEAIASFGKQHDYDLIVSDGVLFANPRIDVTERILESLLREDARLRSAN